MSRITSRPSRPARAVCTAAAGIAAAALLAPPAALAHTGVGSTAGFAAGFAHPFSGLDHLLAMLGIGLLAARAGGRMLWRAPAVFLAFLLAGAALAFAGVPVPGVEAGIALSLPVFAAALLLPTGVLPSFTPVLVAAFALFHGHAHGSEMPVGASGLAYALGFTAASGLLHLSGIALRQLADRRVEPVLRGACALAMIVVGFGALAG